MKFITVTLRIDDKKVRLNVAHIIQYGTNSASPDYSYIKTSNGGYLIVTETVDRIDYLIIKA